MKPKVSFFQRGRRVSVGAPPGTLAPDPTHRPSEIHVLTYGKEAFEDQVVGLGQVETLPEPGWDVRIWVNVDGLGDVGALEEVARRFDIHHLALEDVVNVGQRSKVEDYEQACFIVLRMPREGTSTEQLAIFFGEGFVLTFQEQPGDCLEPVRKRIRQGRPRIRSSGADYLAYAIIDAVIDAYFPILEDHGDDLLHLETRLLNEEPVEVKRLYDIKRSLLGLRSMIRPIREATTSLHRLDSPLIQKDTRPYLRDCVDHATQLVELVEQYHDLSSSLIELHRSNAQARLNEVMKVLTIIATLFIPMTFVAGLYGMNFDTGSPWNLPELGWRFGYPFALALMGIVALVMLFYFRRKGWIGGSDTSDGKDRR